MLVRFFLSFFFIEVGYFVFFGSKDEVLRVCMIVGRYRGIFVLRTLWVSRFTVIFGCFRVFSVSRRSFLGWGEYFVLEITVGEDILKNYFFLVY